MIGASFRRLRYKLEDMLRIAVNVLGFTVIWVVEACKLLLAKGTRKTAYASKASLALAYA